MKMKTVLLVCFCVGLNYAMRLKKPKIPFELRRVMANVTSLDSFVQAMSIEGRFMSSLRDIVSGLNKKGKKRQEHLANVSGNDCPAVNRPKDCSPTVKDLCTNDLSCKPNLRCCNTGCRKECSRTFSELGRGLIEPDFPNLPYVILDSAECKARPVAVEVPQPVNQDAFYYPFFVTLHRCGGACSNRPFETKCQAQESQDLNLVVSKVAWSSASDKLHELSKEMTAVRVTNHTKCGCLCATTPADCDNRTERYNQKTCRCECKPRGVPCPFNFIWNPEKCQCTCNLKNHRCHKRYEFDEKLCRCTCSSKKCKMAPKIRDPRDCRCKCPTIVRCPIGMVYDRQRCECIGKSGGDRR